MINSIQIAGDLSAQVTLRERVIGIAPKINCPAVLRGHDHAAGVGAIVRTDSPDRR